MIAIIAGATGLTGSLLLSKILKDPAIIKVISITRRPLNFNHPKLTEVFIPDISKMLDHADELKGDIYFCCLGTTIKVAGSKEQFRKVDFDAVTAFGKLAETHQAQSLTVISASMADANSSIFYNQVKGETERALMNLKLNRLILLRPGLLIGERKESRVAEEISIKLFKFFSPVIPQKIEKSFATTIEALAERMLKEGKNSASMIKIIPASDI